MNKQECIWGAYRIRVSVCWISH